MQVRDIMTRDVDLANPDMTIREAAIHMRDNNIGALPIGENDRLVGMVTDRDIAIRAVAEDRPSDSTTIRDVMSQGIDYCFEDDDLHKAAKIMAEHQIRRLPVLNRDKRMVGIVSMADLARAGEEGLKATEEAYKGVAEPTGQPRRH